jgi:hypothetical protein
VQVTLSGPPQAGSDDDRNSRFLTFWTTLPGILTGVAAVITAIVGLITLLNSGGSHDERATSSVGQARVTPATTNSTTAPPTAGTTTQSSTGQVNSGAVLAQGRLEMMRGDHADLERGSIGIEPNADLMFGPESTPHLFGTGSAYLASSQGRPLKRGCAVALSGRQDPFVILPQRASDSICVSTTEGHVALVRIIAAPRAGSARLRLQYTVWR